MVRDADHFFIHCFIYADCFLTVGEAEKMIPILMGYEIIAIVATIAIREFPFFV